MIVVLKIMSLRNFLKSLNNLKSIWNKGMMKRKREGGKKKGEPRKKKGELRKKKGEMRKE